MDKKIIYAIIGIALLIFFINTEKKESPPGAVVSRTLPATAAAGSNVNIVVTVSGVTGDYFATIREDIPIGWTYVSGGALEGSQVKGFVSNIATNTLSYTLQAPASGETTTFTGTYQFTDDPSPIPTTAGDTQMEICGSQSYQSCYLDDIYWFDSCSQAETLVTDCGTDSCGSPGVEYCSGLEVRQDTDCNDRGCSGSSCFDTPYTDTQTLSTCTWQCTTGNCMRNSNADTDNSGVVSDTELLTYASDWLASLVNDLDLLQAASVWLGEADYPVEV